MHHPITPINNLTIPQWPKAGRFRHRASSMPQLSDPPMHIDSLEYARGVLCSLSFVATDNSREVHVARLHEQFDRAGIASSMADALETLKLMREAEELGGGYWIPAPIRAVDLGGKHCLLIGVHPTEELRRHFGSARRAGAGRVADAEEVVGLPRQSLAAWRGYDGRDASTLARTAIESGMQQLAPSVMDEGLETFGTRTGGGATGRYREPAWVRVGDGAACTWRGVGLFRSRTSAARYRYFLGRHQSQSTFLEGPPARELIRMQFGLAALQNQPLTLRIASSRDAVSISLPLSAPTELRRLLVALCDTDARSFGRVWTCRNPEYLPALQASLQELESETAHHE